MMVVHLWPRFWPTLYVERYREDKTRHLTAQQTHPSSVLVPSDTKKSSRQVTDEESHT